LSQSKKGVNMPRTEEANQRIREEQRAKILDAAWRAFAKKGASATMAEVAAEADVSYGLVYRYFSSKEAIFKALVEQMLQSGTLRVQNLLGQPGTPGERLTFLITKILEVRRERSDAFLLFQHVMSDETMADDLRKRLRERGQAYYDGMRQLIVEAQASGEVVASDPDQLVVALLAYLDGLSRFAVREPEMLKQHFPDPEIVLRMLKP
jgi:AcrR family transcriptional regulator